MKKAKKTPRTIVPVANPSAAGKNKRLPKQPFQYWQKSDSMYHN